MPTLGMRSTLLLTGLCTTAALAGPATQPSTPRPTFEPAPLVGQAIDPTKPAFVPKFAKIDNPPAGQYEERKYAYFYTYSTPFFFGYGGYGYGSYGYGGYGYRSFGYGYGYGGFGYGFGGPRSWGSTQVPFR